MESNEEAVAGLLAYSKGSTGMEGSQMTDVRPANKKETEMKAQKRMEPSSPSDVTCRSNEDETTCTGTVEDNVEVHVAMLETVLRRDFTEMAEVLKENDKIKKDIRMCVSCSVNIGCH